MVRRHDVAVPIWAGVHFYGLHRLLHVGWFYRHIHSWHHKTSILAPGLGWPCIRVRAFFCSRHSDFLSSQPTRYTRFFCSCITVSVRQSATLGLNICVLVRKSCPWVIFSTSCITASSTATTAHGTPHGTVGLERSTTARPKTMIAS